jgi:two-component system, chemotaxis family, chemotaxis protein CheY
MGKETNGVAGGARPITILIVDDSAVMRALLKRVVSLSDVPVETVLEARNGREALQILEANHVDALFTDINMPVMTGHELLREVAKQDRWRDMLRVVISTDGSKLRREEARELKVELYVEKPFRPEVVRDVLSEIASAAR